MSTLRRLWKRHIPAPLSEVSGRLYLRGRAIRAHVRHGFPSRGLRLIGVTGTNGKTTTCEYISSIITHAGRRVGTSSTATMRVGPRVWRNSSGLTTGTPEALCRLLEGMRASEVREAVLEVSSHALAQHRVWGLEFDWAVVTNLTPDHLNYHRTMDAYADTKAALVTGARRAVVLNRDDEWFEFFRGRAKAPVFSFGWSKDADLCLDRVQSLGPEGSQVDFHLRGVRRRLHVRLPGRFNVLNALTAVATGEALDLPWCHIRRGVEEVKAVPGRMETISTASGSTVVIDYAHTPEAVRAAVGFLEENSTGRVISVLGSSPSHDAFGVGREAGTFSDLVVVTDEEPYWVPPADLRKMVAQGVRDGGRAEVQEVADRRNAIGHALKQAGPQDTVAVLGMGVQPTRQFGERSIPWDERAVVEELIRGMET